MYFYITTSFCIFVKIALKPFILLHMSFAERLTEVRKKRGISQEVLASQLGTKGPAIGRYERGTAKPTIEVAAKIANVLGVSLDYLVGNSDTELDAGMISRIQQVALLDEEDKKMIYTFLDSFIDKARIKGILK